MLCWDSGEATYGSDPNGAMWLYSALGGWVHSFLVTPVEVPECTDEPAGSELRPFAPGTGEGSGGFDNCDEARAAGAAPLLRGQPGYTDDLDGDDDGIACEWN